MNTANKITLARVIAIPLFIFFFDLSGTYGNLVAAILFVVAAASDGLDGYIARKYNQITTFGKFIDPLADKLLITAALICLVGASKLSPWFAIIIISREFMVTGLRLLAMSNGSVISASMWGKVKTVSQIIAVAILLFDINPVMTQIGNVSMVIAVILTVISGIDYFIKNGKYIEYK